VSGRDSNKVPRKYESRALPPLRHSRRVTHHMPGIMSGLYSTDVTTDEGCGLGNELRSVVNRSLVVPLMSRQVQVSLLGWPAM
jgi:hypothetical protein